MIPADGCRCAGIDGGRRFKTLWVDDIGAVVAGKGGGCCSFFHFVIVSIVGWGVMGSCGHNHDCGAHGHGESGDDGEEWSLFNEVDTERCFALNEAVPGSLKGVLKPWTERLQTEPVLRSDSDEQLLICIPFCTAVKLKAICLIGSGGQENPKTMKAFLNVESMDFSSAESTTPIQTWDLIDDNQNGTIEYRTKYTKFQNVQNVRPKTPILLFASLPKTSRCKHGTALPSVIMN